jgi:2-methylcitrate dehydratase PrpD
MLDVLLGLRRDERFTADDVAAISVGVDAITPTVLLHERPVNGLQAKFSMHYCAAAAVVDGRVGIDTFDDDQVRRPEIEAVRGRVKMAVDPTLDPSAPPLTQVRVSVSLQRAHTFAGSADGARGYPRWPASDEELAEKFLSCATRVLPRAKAQRALDAVRALADVSDVRTVLDLLR